MELLRFVALWTIGCFFLTLAKNGFSQDSQLAEILEAFHNQEQVVRSVSLSIDAQQRVSTRDRQKLEPKHENVRSDRDSSERGIELSNTVSSDFHMKILFMKENDRARIKSSRSIYNDMEKRLFASTSDFTVDGDEYIRSLRTRESQKAARGAIHTKERRNIDIDTASYRPIWLAFSPFSSKNLPGMTLDKMEVIGRKELSDGQTAIILARPDKRRVLWIDGGNYTTLLKYVITDRSNTSRAIVDITKSKIEQGVSIPLQWEVSYFGSNGALKSFEMLDVLDYEINPKLDQSDFHLEFPPGTLVSDERLPTNQYSFIDFDGSVKKVAKSGIDSILLNGVTVEDSLTSKSWNPILVLLNSIIVLVLVLLYIRKRAAVNQFK